jgi:probable HAF family extracellular repeat protein
MKDLGTLPGDTDSAAFGVNSRGDVVGYSLGPTGMRAFLWRPAEGMQSLGALPGHTTTKALGINEKAQVVGTSGSDQARAVLWESNRVPRDLNALITGVDVVLTEAVGINARGQILALGRTGHDARLAHHEGPNKVFLLTPSASN